jgi:DNA-3-methyladenine glycosylase
MSHDCLPRSFYQRDPVSLARDLLGQRLVRLLGGHRLAGLIVETEAYLGVPDRAAHTYAGRRTPRNASMWCDGGRAYVYFTYGMHYCLNVVAGREAEPVAVLLRALDPVEGQSIMFIRRPRARHPGDLCSGPAKLCQALAITRKLDGTDLTLSDQLWIEPARTTALPARSIVRTPRIGVAYAGPWARKPLRFYLRGNPHVSGA